MTIEEEPSTNGGVTGALATVSAELDIEKTQVSLAASGVVNAARKDALTLSLVSMCLTVPPASSSESVQSGCESVARTLLPAAELDRGDCCCGQVAHGVAHGRYMVASGDALLAEVVLEQLYLDQDLHAMRAPNEELVVLSRP